MVVHLRIYTNLIISGTGDVEKEVISGPHRAEPKSASSFQVARSWTTKKSSLSQRMKAALRDILFLPPASHAQTLPCLSAVLGMKLGPRHAKQSVTELRDPHSWGILTERTAGNEQSIRLTGPNLIRAMPSKGSKKTSLLSSHTEAKAHS